MVKLIQNGHTLRAKEIEEALINNNFDIQHPRILGAYYEKSEINRNNNKWIKLMFF